MPRRSRRRRDRACSIESLERRQVLATSLGSDVWSISGDVDPARPDDMIVVDRNPADA